MKGKTNRQAAKEEQTRLAGPWAANRLEVRQTHSGSDTESRPPVFLFDVLFGSGKKKAAQSAHSSVRPAIWSPPERETARLLHLFGSVISEPLLCGRRVQSASALRGLFAHRQAETDTSQSVRMVFMINWQSGLASCNHHERFLFHFSFFFFSKSLVQCTAAWTEITFDLENQSHVRSTFSPAERHSLRAWPAGSAARARRLPFSVQTPLDGRSSRNAERLFAFLKAKPAKQTPLSCPPPTLAMFVFSLAGHAAAEGALSERVQSPGSSII